MEYPNTTQIEIPKKDISAGVGKAKEGDTQALAEKYFRTFFLPGIIATIFAVSAQFIDNTFWISLIAYVALLMYVSWRLYEEKASPKISFWAMFVAMLMITFLVAVVKLVINFKFVYFLNLITEPLIYAIIGGALGYLVMLALTRGQKNPKPETKPKQ
ncbi:hypothetical protein KKC88_04620 [Patescibacteria group bacterium]|nr:hypothetical protein [Patescibacteria group bacterium]MBU1674014.1 hypothetical protein [Patescibacteria group bacterium]MBU1963168.1 hypothetical protein [Patescibacteria group bacterium]